MQKLKEIVAVILSLVVGLGLLALVVFGSQGSEAQAMTVRGVPQAIAPARVTAPRNGAELVEYLGLRGKTIYIVYGRPMKRGEQTWGTLGASQTAEQSWQVLRNSASAVGRAIGQDSGSFALHVLNPVYRSQNGVIADVYIQKALELAALNKGVVALSFNSFSDAEGTIARLEKVTPSSLLAYLAVSLDIEHFSGGGTASAEQINSFSSWFMDKHSQWAGNLPVPGLVIVYTFRTSGVGSIANLNQLKQYYMAERGLVVPIFDGYGMRQVKAEKVARLARALPNTPESPALVGVMEFQTRWGTKYDQATISESFSILAGSPVRVFASQ